MANRVPTISISAEAIEKKNAYIKELETRLRLATSPEKAKQLRDHVEAMSKAIDGILSTACQGTKAMRMTQQLCVPLEKLDAAKRALKEPEIEKPVQARAPWAGPLPAPLTNVRDFLPPETTLANVYDKAPKTAQPATGAAS